MFRKTDKTIVFIDGSNMFESIKMFKDQLERIDQSQKAEEPTPKFDIDYDRLKLFFDTRVDLIRINYYTAMLPDGVESPIRPLMDYLSYNGYNLVTKLAKEYKDGDTTRIKGNVDVDMTVDVMLAAEYVDHVILMTGDGDFRRLVEEVQRKGVRVSVISTNLTQPSMIADELRRQADEFIDLYDIRESICRNRP